MIGEVEEVIKKKRWIRKIAQVQQQQQYKGGKRHKNTVTLWFCYILLTVSMKQSSLNHLGTQEEVETLSIKYLALALANKCLKWMQLVLQVREKNGL